MPPINTDYFLKPGETTEQYMARTGVTQKQNTAKAAGAAGATLNDTASLLGVSDEEQRAEKDSLAKTFGYPSFDDFTKEAFSKPSQSTQQFYEQAYKTAGLDEKVSRISKLKNDLSQAEFAINDNPWLAEASRSGHVRRVQELANATIGNEEHAYTRGLDQVKNLVAAHSDDVGQDERIREARFKYLTQAAEEAADRAAKLRMSEYLPEYLKGKESSNKPDTISVGEGQAIYQWNPSTATFEPVVTRSKTYAPPRTTTTKTNTANTSSADKTVSAFRTALSNRAALNRAGTREQFIRELQAKHPQIEPSDIARAVYTTYPDNYQQ
jgi:hypothetical protein